MNRGDEAFGGHERARRFQLPGGDSIADHSVTRDVERRDSIEKILLDRLEQRQVCFVIDHVDVGGRFLAGFRAFQLDIILVRNQVRRHQNAAFGENRAEGALGYRRFLLPRPKIIVGLAGNIHPHQRKQFLFNVFVAGAGDRRFLFRDCRSRDECETNPTLRI